MRVLGGVGGSGRALLGGIEVWLGGWVGGMFFAVLAELGSSGSGMQ